MGLSPRPPPPFPWLASQRPRGSASPTISSSHCHPAASHFAPSTSGRHYYPRLPTSTRGRSQSALSHAGSQPKLPLQPNTHPPRAPRPSTQHSWHRNTRLLRCPLSLKVNSDVTFPKSFSGLSNPHPEPSHAALMRSQSFTLPTEPSPHNEAEDWSRGRGALHTLHQGPGHFTTMRYLRKTLPCACPTLLF